MKPPPRYPPLTLEVEKLEKTALELVATMERKAEDGLIDPVFRCLLADGQPREFPLPEGSEQLMSSGEKKEALFGWFRQYTAAHGAACWMFATFAWSAEPTEAGKRLTAEERLAIPFHELEPRGLAKKFESILVTVQTKTDVVLAQQLFVRDPEGRPRWVGQPDISRMPQSAFHGRQKMWGATRADEVGYDPARMKEEGLS